MGGHIGATVIVLGGILLYTIPDNDVKVEIRAYCEICGVKSCVEREGADAIRVGGAQRSPIVGWLVTCRTTAICGELNLHHAALIWVRFGCYIVGRPLHIDGRSRFEWDGYFCNSGSTTVFNGGLFSISESYAVDRRYV